MNIKDLHNRTFNEVIFEGKPILVMIDTYIFNDEFPIIGEHFDFGNEDDNKDYVRDFELGKYISIGITIEVHNPNLHVSGKEHLGCCHIASKTFDNDIEETIKDHGMIENAKAEFLKNLTETINEYKKLVG